MMKAILSILDIKKKTIIAKVNGLSTGTNLIVQTTHGREIITGVTEIVERGDFVVFVANGSAGRGGIVAKHLLVSAIPE